MDNHKPYTEIKGNPFCYYEDFFPDHASFIEWMHDKDMINKIHDFEEWSIIVSPTKLEPIFQLSPDKLAEILHDSFYDRFSENGIDSEYNKVKECMKNWVDYAGINSGLPRLQYSTGEKYVITWEMISEDWGKEAARRDELKKKEEKQMMDLQNEIADYGRDFSWE